MPQIHRPLLEFQLDRTFQLTWIAQLQNVSSPQYHKLHNWQLDAYTLGEIVNWYDTLSRKMFAGYPKHQDLQLLWSFLFNVENGQFPSSVWKHYYRKESSYERYNFTLRQIVKEQKNSNIMKWILTLAQGTTEFAIIARLALDARLSCL